MARTLDVPFVRVYLEKNYVYTESYACVTAVPFRHGEEVNMYNWKCTACGYTTESERCPSCKYANCRGCHILEYADNPPGRCPSCRQNTRFVDLDEQAVHSGGHVA